MKHETPDDDRRRILLDSKSTTRVELMIAPGDELDVSLDVALQLQGADVHFIEVEQGAKAAAARKRADEAARLDAKEAAAREAKTKPGPASGAETLPTLPDRVKDLREYAAERSIDLGGARSKEEIVAVIEAATAK